MKVKRKIKTKTTIRLDESEVAALRVVLANNSGTFAYNLWRQLREAGNHPCNPPSEEEVQREEEQRRQRLRKSMSGGKPPF